MEAWSDFFVAEAGAAAALAGLIFVAVSINLDRVLQYRNLPTRIIEALVSLLSILAAATFGLIPGQSIQAFGWEVGGTMLAVWLLRSVVLIRWIGVDVKYGSLALRIVTNQIGPLPFLVGAVMLVMGNPYGMYWIVPGTLLSFVAGMADAWVLLIEIKR